MALPVHAREVWVRMLRNLSNCHEQQGDLCRLRVVRAMLECNASMSGDEAAAVLAYDGSEHEAPDAARERAVSAHQQQLMRMLQVLQLQQQQQQQQS